MDERTERKILESPATHRKVTIQNLTTDRERFLLVSSDHMLRAEGRRLTRNRRQREGRKARAEAYRSAGLVRCKGALGGTYWE